MTKFPSTLSSHFLSVLSVVNLFFYNWIVASSFLVILPATPCDVIST